MPISAFNKHSLDSEAMRQGQGARVSINQIN